MYAVTKSIFADIYSIYVEPKKVFTKSSNDFGAFWVPLLLIPLLIFMANYAYFERVSPEYFVEEQLAQKQDISKSEYDIAENLLLDMHGSRAYITSTVEVLTWLCIGLLAASYLFLVANSFSNRQLTFSKSLVWTSWLLMPLCIAKIISIVAIFNSGTVASELNIGPENIGDFFLFNDDWFRLVGIGEKKGCLFGIDQDDYIHIPNNTLNAMISKKYHSDISISFSTNESSNVQTVKSSIKTLISENHLLTPEFSQNIKFIDTKRSVKEFDSMSTGITYIALIIVSISVIVGAIGVTNTMMASYKERIREIGISKAISATDTFIMCQYMAEGVSLTMLGGRRRNVWLRNWSRADQCCARLSHSTDKFRLLSAFYYSFHLARAGCWIYACEESELFDAN